MATAMLKFTAYDEQGLYLGGGNIFLPDYLDWMPIQAKSEWYKLRGMGNPAAKYALLESQGQQQLVWNLSLKQLKHAEMKEQEDGIGDAIQAFIDREGLSRDPRNQ